MARAVRRAAPASAPPTPSRAAACRVRLRQRRLRPAVQPLERRRARRLLEAPLPARSARTAPAAAAVIRVAGGVNPGHALAARQEVLERLAARVGDGLVVRVVEERAGGVREEDRVVLLQVLGGDVVDVPRRRRRPRAGLLAHLLDHFRRERNRRVLESGRREPRPDQDLARLLRRCRRLVGKQAERRDHSRHVVRTRLRGF